MVPLIVGSAPLLAVSDSFALALDLEDGTLIAKLALTNLDPALIFIFKGESWGRDLNQDNLLGELMVVKGQTRTDVRLE